MRFVRAEVSAGAAIGVSRVRIMALPPALITDPLVSMPVDTPVVSDLMWAAT